MTLLLLALACKEPTAAAPEMDQTARGLWTQWEDPAQMELLLADLMELTDGVELESDWEDRAYYVTAFERENVDELVEHELDPLETFGIGMLYPSTHPISDHMQLIAIQDRTIVEKSSPNLYTRSFYEGDPECMEQDCELMRAENRIRRESFFYGQMTYEMNKSWRWVDTQAGDALVARSYQHQPSEEQDNKVRLLQSYSLDIWMPEGDGVRRFHMSWQQTVMPGGLEDSEISGVLGGGINTLMQDQDEWLDENL